MSDDGPYSGNFLVTQEYRRFAEFCAACLRDRYIGVCYGVPGVGKTLSARHYALWDIIEIFSDPRVHQFPPLRTLRCRTVFYTPGVVNSPRIIEDDIYQWRDKMSWLVDKAYHIRAHPHDRAPWEMPNHGIMDRTELIIVDEADRLKQPGLEQLRDIYDRHYLGLILIGMPGIEKRLARYPQLYSRVGFVHHFRVLSQQEVLPVLTHMWQQLGKLPDAHDSAEVNALIIRITGGNFRLIQRLFTQIQRILDINSLDFVTSDVVDVAREALVIGAL